MGLAWSGTAGIERDHGISGERTGTERPGWPGTEPAMTVGDRTPLFHCQWRFDERVIVLSPIVRKWTRFSAPDDALFKELNIGSRPLPRPRIELIYEAGRIRAWRSPLASKRCLQASPAASRPWALAPAWEGPAAPRPFTTRSRPATATSIPRPFTARPRHQARWRAEGCGVRHHQAAVYGRRPAGRPSLRLPQPESPDLEPRSFSDPLT